MEAEVRAGLPFNCIPTLKMNFRAPQGKLGDLAQPSHLDIVDNWASPDLEYDLAGS